MNTLILLLLVGMAITSPQGFIGIVGGLFICFVIFERCDVKNSSIVWHLTHWSWWDIRV